MALVKTAYWSGELGHILRKDARGGWSKKRGEGGPEGKEETKDTERLSLLALYCHTCALEGIMSCTIYILAFMYVDWLPLDGVRNAHTYQMRKKYTRLCIK